MARINDRLLVQRVDDLMVVMDDSTGAEITFPVTDTVNVVRALAYLLTGDPEVANEVGAVLP